MKTTSMSKRLYALILAIAMLLQIAPMTAFADGLNTTRSNPTGGDTYSKIIFYVNGTSEIEMILENGIISVLPQDPYQEGYNFKEWNTQEDGNGQKVTMGFTVSGTVNVYAIFEKIKIYEVTAEFFYKNAAGENHPFERQTFQFNTDTYTIDCPANIYQDQTVTGNTAQPIYYPNGTTITVNKSDYTEDDYDADRNVYTKTITKEYVPYTAEFTYVYILKNLDGTESVIERVNDKGVIDTNVTAPVKQYAHMTFLETTPVYIDKASGIEINVYYTPDTVTLSYNTQGGSYIAPQTVAYGQNAAVTKTVPTRTGYQFTGWYDQVEGGNKITAATLEMKDDKVLFAHWEGKEVNYTIVYLFEKYNEAGSSAAFEYDNSETARAKTGTTVKAASAPDKTRKGYEYDTAQNATSEAVIEADGSSVLYVYYKLKTYTIYFRPGTVSVTNMWGITNNYNVTATLNGDQKSGNSNFSYTMSVKLGQDISGSWPLGISGGTYNYGSKVTFQGWQTSGVSEVYATKRLTVTADLLPADGSSITYTASWTSDTVTYTINYWLQNADNNEYTKSDRYSQTLEYKANANVQPKEISGFTYKETKKSNKVTVGHGPNKTEYYLTYDIYYTRNAYKIDYYYGSRKLDTISNVKFDANISSSRYNWTPTRARCGVDSDYTWGGWYADKNLMTAYTFSTMPSSNVVVYGKWTAPSFEVSFNVNGGEGTTPSQTVFKNKTVDYPTVPTRAHYSFAGWYTNADCTARYDFNAPVTSSFTLYAGWKQDPISYTVKYLDAATKDPLAGEKTVTNAAFTEGMEIEEIAVTIVGMIPDSGAKTVSLSLTKDNVIEFLYSPRGKATKYTVQYVLASNHEIKVHSDKVVNDPTGSLVEVNETAVSADTAWMKTEYPGTNYYQEKYHPTTNSKTLKLSSNDENNIIIFEYINYDTARCTLNYLDMDGKPFIEAKTELVQVGGTFIVNTADQGDYVFDHVEGNNGLTYMISEGTPITVNAYYRLKMTITAENLSKTYDGSALKSGENDYSVSGLKKGHTVTSVTFSGEQTDAGKSKTTPSAAVITGPASGADYYKIEYIEGQLEVKKAAVNITINPDRMTQGAVYQASAYEVGFTKPNWTIADYVTISNETYKTEHLSDITDKLEDRFTGGVIISEVNAGTYRKAAADIFTEADLPEDDNYDVKLDVRGSELVIDRAPLELTARTLNGTYNGDPFTASAVSLANQGFSVYLQNPDKSLKGGDQLTAVTESGSITNVSEGPVANTITAYTIMNADNTKEVSDNYEVQIINGELTLNPRSIKIKVDHAEKYAGQEDPAFSYKVDPTSDSTILPEDQATLITGVVRSDKDQDGGEDIGEHKDVLVLDYDTNNKNYKISVTPGTLTIHDGFTVIFQPGEYGSFASGTAGSDGNVTYTSVAYNSDTPNAPKVNADDDHYFTGWVRTAPEPVQPGLDDKVTGDTTYTAQYEEKALATLCQPEVTLTYNGTTQVYDASLVGTGEYKDGEFVLYTNPNGSLKEGHHWEYDFTVPSGKDVGAYKGSFSNVTILDADGNNVSEQYKINTEVNDLIIEPAELTVTVQNSSKVFGEKDPETYTLKLEGLAGGETEEEILQQLPASYGLTIERTSGETATTYDVTMQYTKTSTQNYLLNLIPGKFTINPREVTVIITGHKGSLTYSGTEQSIFGYDLTLPEEELPGLSADEKGKYALKPEDIYGPDQEAVSVSGTEPGIYELGLTEEDFAFDEGSQPNYKVNFSVEDGALEILEIYFDLTVRYWQNGTNINTVSRNLARNTPYDIATPPIEGYIASIARVTGILTQDTEIDVTYTINTYGLTIQYLFADGREAAPAYKASLNYGAAYAVDSPAVEGYNTTEPTVAGTMPARDVIVTVFYAALPVQEVQEETPAEAPAAAAGPFLVNIDDFETPLGLGLFSINAGETIE